MVGLGDPTALLERWAAAVWSPPMLVLLIGTGLLLTIRLRFLPQRWLVPAVRHLLLGASAPGRRTPRGPPAARAGAAPETRSAPPARRPGPQPAGNWPARAARRARRLVSALAPALPAHPGTVSALADRRRRLGPEGEISSFQALSTALAATVGTGNIVGVATAIALGGPGAVLWMWLTALVGTATKFSEAVLAVTYRVRMPGGEHAGGPMYYIRNIGGCPRGLAPFLAGAFALFTALAAFGTGNLIQANAVAQALEASFRVPVAFSGVLLSGLTGVVVLGGIRRIGRVAATVVPAMTLVYAAASLLALWTARTEVPGAVLSILQGAFQGTAVRGGFAGAAFALVVRTGVSRGLLSNEAGLGSSPIAHAAARAGHPAEEGMVAMLATYIDTLVVGTLTALVILSTGVWQSGATGAALSAAAFRVALPGPGDLIVSLGLVFFAFTTIIGWSYYGERAVVYLLGPRALAPYRVVWTAAAFAGAVSRVRAVWALSDTMNGLMALPNLVALVALSGVVVAVVRSYEPAG